MDENAPRVPFGAAGFGWRVSLTILLGVGWLAFLILFLFFWAGQYNFYEDIGILIVSILIVLGALAAMWASFGLKMAERVGMEEPGVRVEMKRWMGWRGILSSLIWLGWVLFLVLWLFFEAGRYNGYQNIAVLIVSLIVAGGLSSLLWRMFWRRY